MRDNKLIPSRNQKALMHRGYLHSITHKISPLAVSRHTYQTMAVSPWPIYYLFLFPPPGRRDKLIII